LRQFDYVLGLDPGASGPRFALFRSPGFANAYFLGPGCEEISADAYERESKDLAKDWGCGVVKVPVNGGDDLYYRVGQDPLDRTSEATGKWRKIVAKLLCALGCLGQSSTTELVGDIKILMPVDEFSFQMPMLEAIAYALKNGAGFHGRPIKNIKIGGIEVMPEGSGLIENIRDPQMSIMAGHCDVSVVMGKYQEVWLDHSFTVSGAGAIAPLRLSTLPIVDDEINASIAFMRKDWEYFAVDGLQVSHVEKMASEGLAKYIGRQAGHIAQIKNACRSNRITTVRIGGGSAWLAELLMKDSGLRIVNTKETERIIAKKLGIKDKFLPPKLTDIYAHWMRSPQVEDYFTNGPDTQVILPVTANG
jgi:hypothetical protein